MSKNRKKGIVILLLGIVIMVLSLLFPIGSSNFTENGRLERNEFGEGEKQISLIAITNQEETIIEYNVAERKFTESEIQNMLPEFKAKLESAVLGANESLDKIQSTLSLVEQLEGYPFYITWSSERSDLIGSEGNLKEEIVEPVPVMMTAEFEYEEWIFEHSFLIVLVPREYSPLEEWVHQLEDALVRADEESKNQTYMNLPQTIGGTSVKWSEKRENKGLKIGGFCVAVAIIFFYADSTEKKEREKKRLQEIRKDYPEFVMKCAMLVGAGMTPRQVFERLGKVYRENDSAKNPLYEEVLVTNRELGNRIAERRVYESFGRRCGIRETEKLGSMLSRNLTKGTEGLKNALREEAKEAMEMEKERIRKQGETAGTKLLFPMLILLLIVMVIIMIPAFSTFSI